MRGPLRSGRRRAAAGAACALLALAPVATLCAQASSSIWQELVGQSADAFTAALIDATVLVERGEPARAVASCERAIALAPERPDGHACLLRALHRAGRHDELLSRVEALRIQGPGVLTYPQVAHFPAMVLAERGDYAGAAEWLRSSTRYRAVQSSTAIHYGNLGELYAAGGDGATALLFYRQALAADPDYHLARIGLAAALARSGDLTTARSELTQVLLADPTLSVLQTPGLFGVPEGELLLWRALLAEVGGRAEEASGLLAEFATTPSGAASAELLSRLEGERRQPVGQTSTIEVPGCRPVQVAFAPGEQRLAVACEGADVREGPLRDGRASLQRVDRLQYESCCTWGAPIAGSVADLAYSPDGTALRLIYADGQTEQLPIGGATGTPALRPLDNYDLRPVSFVGDGARVLVASQVSNGAYLGAWDAPLAPAQLVSTADGGWISQARATPDGRFVESSDGTTLTVYELVNNLLQQRASFAFGQSWAYGWLAALSTDGRLVLTARGPMLVLHRVATGRAEAFHTLAELAGTDPASGTVAFVEALGPDRFVIGTQDRVHVFQGMAP